MFGKFIDKIEKFQILLLAIIFAVGGAIAVSMVTKSMSNDSIFVTGSYTKKVVSDNGNFNITLRTRKETKSESFKDLNRQIPIVTNYLKKNGIDPKDIDIKTPYGYNIYELTYNGISTNRVIAYEASRTLTVKSKDVQKIKKLASDIISLNSKDVDLTAQEPEYFYSKLSDLKVQMLQQATKDAYNRASAMLKATDNKVGKIKSVQMGVFQITPVDSTDVSDSGISDTSSIEKKITSVANVTFRIK